MSIDRNYLYYLRKNDSNLDDFFFDRYCQLFKLLKNYHNKSIDKNLFNMYRFCIKKKLKTVNHGIKRKKLIKIKEWYFIVNI